MSNGKKPKGKKKTTMLPVPPTEGCENRIYKVRAAITLSNYMFVTASCPDDAERKIKKFIREMDRNHGGYDWYGEASHMHTSFEVEEAE